MLICQGRRVEHSQSKVRKREARRQRRRQPTPTRRAPGAGTRLRSGHLTRWIPIRWAQGPAGSPAAAPRRSAAGRASLESNRLLGTPLSPTTVMRVSNIRKCRNGSWNWAGSELKYGCTATRAETASLLIAPSRLPIACCRCHNAMQTACSPALAPAACPRLQRPFGAAQQQRSAVRPASRVQCSAGSDHGSGSLAERVARGAAAVAASLVLVTGGACPLTTARLGPSCLNLLGLQCTVAQACTGSHLPALLRMAL